MKMQTQISELTLLVQALREEISLLKNGRNSTTNSTVPSQDIGHSNASLFLFIRFAGAGNFPFLLA
jgi:hypothetical protein